jgi:YVTN family beta-propeller protein
MFDPFSKKVFVFKAKANSVSVLNAETNKVESTIPLAGNPEFSVSDGKGKVYVNLENKSCIAVINSFTLKVENVWSLAPGEEPTGLALDNDNHRLFSVCANKLMVVVDEETGKVITTLPIGEKTDGAAFDPELKCAYSSNGDGTLTVVKELDKDSFEVLENVQTQKGAKTITVNKKTHHIYLPTASFETQSGVEKPKVVPGTFIILDIMPQ